jgi:deazaflavin-dependent oxidoreductase (nitroreductase family)
VDRKARDEAIVAEYRATGGIPAVGSPQLIVLHTIGQRTGITHVKPVCVIEDGDDLVVAGTMGGNPRHPQWYRNITANPELTVEYRGETFRVRATTEPNGATRDRLFAEMDTVIPGIHGYQDRCRETRQIPIIRLVRS